MSCDDVRCESIRCELRRGVLVTACLTLMLGIVSGTGVSWAQPASKSSSKTVGKSRATGDKGGRSEGPQGDGKEGSLRLRSGVSAPETHSVVRGDTLWDVSDKYYGTPWAWPQLWSFNPEITNPHWIYPDQLLRLRGGGTGGAGAPTSGKTSSLGRPHAMDEAQPGRVLVRNRGFLQAGALPRAGKIVGARKDRMMLSTGDVVYVQLDEAQHVQPGQTMSVFRVLTKKERNPGESGDLVRIDGMLRLLDYDPGRAMGRAVIEEASDPIERNHLVSAQVERIRWVLPVPNRVSAQGKVVATLHPREFVRPHQLVFIDIGRKQGLLEGNRVFLVRNEDPWRASLRARPEDYGATMSDEDAPKTFLDEVVAEARVVHVMEESAAVWVQVAMGEAKVGDRVEVRVGY